MVLKKMVHLGQFRSIYVDVPSFSWIVEQLFSELVLHLKEIFSIQPNVQSGYRDISQSVIRGPCSRSEVLWSAATRSSAPSSALVLAIPYSSHGQRVVENFTIHQLHAAVWCCHPTVLSTHSIFEKQFNIQKCFKPPWKSSEVHSATPGFRHSLALLLNVRH